MKTIFLSSGDASFIDDEDFEKVSKFKWYLVGAKNNQYAGRQVYHGISNGKRIVSGVKMHRFILGVVDKNISVDHKNGNKLDNRKENLRIATASQNQSNRCKKQNNASGFRGVFFKNDKARPRPWAARIQINKKQINLGHFSSAEEAAIAFDKMAIKVFGDFCGRLNFPLEKI